jgi:hypothetical protein
MSIRSGMNVDDSDALLYIVRQSMLTFTKHPVFTRRIAKFITDEE